MGARPTLECLLIPPLAQRELALPCLHDSSSDGGTGRFCYHAWTHSFIIPQPATTTTTTTQPTSIALPLRDCARSHQLSAQPWLLNSHYWTGSTSQQVLERRRAYNNIASVLFYGGRDSIFATMKGISCFSRNKSISECDQDEAPRPPRKNRRVSRQGSNQSQASRCSTASNASISKLPPCKRVSDPHIEAMMMPIPPEARQSRCLRMSHPKIYSNVCIFGPIS